MKARALTSLAVATLALSCVSPSALAQSCDLTIERIEALEARGRAQGAPTLRACLLAGQPDDVSDRALDALATLRDEESLPVLARFLRHRRPGARERAVRALSKLTNPEAEQLVVSALRDPELRVQRAAVASLVAMNARALEPLFTALEGGLAEAAEALGQLGGEAELARMRTALGRLPLAHLLLGFRAFLARPDIAAAQK